MIRLRLYKVCNDARDLEGVLSVLQLFDLCIFANNTAAQNIIDKALLVQLLRQFRGVEFLEETHIPKELLAPPGEFHPVSIKALSEPGIEVSFHTTKARKRVDMSKFNALIINGLKSIYRPYSKSEGALFGGPDAKFLGALKRVQKANNRLIFGRLKTRLAA